MLCPQCGSTGCLGLARFLSDCQSCLVFSGTPANLARAPGEFGWCVQNESCLPVSGETQGGRKEGRREGLNLRLKNERCWELTWEGLDSCWTCVTDRAQWLDCTQLRLDRLLRPRFDSSVQAHTSSGAARSCRFTLFGHRSHKSHRSDSLQYSSAL